MQIEPGRVLPFSKAENFRELGGWPAAGGKTVKHGLFFRCGALCELESEEDLEAFRALGIKVICDLRSTGERTAQPDPAFAGVRRHDISAILDEEGREVNFDPHSFLKMDRAALETLGRMLGEFYARLPFGNAAYRAMFAEIRAGQLPLLFHCSAGKDRTGVAAALILLALGAARETVMQDFLITNTCRPRAAAEYEASYGALVRQYPELKPYLGAMGGVDEANLARALDAIDARYPCLEAYFEAELGMAPADLAAMRAACLE